LVESKRLSSRPSYYRPMAKVLSNRRPQYEASLNEPQYEAPLNEPQYEAPLNEKPNSMVISWVRHSGLNWLLSGTDHRLIG
jgi:hypothetical protein